MSKDCKHWQDSGFSHCSECCDEEHAATYREIHELKTKLAETQRHLRDCGTRLQEAGATILKMDEELAESRRQRKECEKYD
jgi:septal ring factor EnvC (AmiA/AmiB activator)